MKRVFLDTNILIDYALGREHGDDAEQLLQRGCDGEIELAASYLTFANLAYILKSKIDVYELISDLTRYITVLPTDGNQLLTALKQRVRDFEDMLQYQCAKTGRCDFIITGNSRDFAAFCDIPLMSAADFLAQLDS